MSKTFDNTITFDAEKIVALDGDPVRKQLADYQRRVAAEIAREYDRRLQALIDEEGCGAVFAAAKAEITPGWCKPAAPRVQGVICTDLNGHSVRTGRLPS